jgi:hypothetical protein
LIAAGVSVGTTSSTGEVVGVGVHAVNNKMPRSNDAEDLFILSLSLGLVSQRMNSAASELALLDYRT